jgi:hypothetical protein
LTWIQPFQGAGELPQRLVLADTSVWIEYFRNGQNQAAEALDDLLSNGRVVICGPVMAEVLSGIKSPRYFTELKNRLSVLDDLKPPDDIWYIIARKRAFLLTKGFQSSLIDLWIAHVAFEYGVLLWTLDKDFNPITQAIPFEKYLPLF